MEAGVHPPNGDPAARRAAPKRTKRLALATLMAVIGMNIWTGGPLLALWIGSRVQSSGSEPSLTIRPATALTVFAAIAVISFLLVIALNRVSDAYDRAAGVGPGPKRHDRWIASDGPGPAALTALERMLVVMVAICALAFEIWFFFFSTSPIDQRSGRSAVPLAQSPSVVSTCSSPRLRNLSPTASAPSRPTSPAPICTLRSPSSVQ
jgi:hypothetical protein